MSSNEKQRGARHLFEPVEPEVRLFQKANELSSRSELETAYEELPSTNEKLSPIGGRILLLEVLPTNVDEA